MTVSLDLTGGPRGRGALRGAVEIPVDRNSGGGRAMVSREEREKEWEVVLVELETSTGREEAAIARTGRGIMETERGL